MLLCRLSLVLSAILLITSWSQGDRSSRSSNASACLEADVVISQTILPASSIPRHRAISTIALVAYQLKSERDETDSLISEESRLRRAVLPNQPFDPTEQTSRPDAVSAMVPLRC
jgi:hypothetical protein